MSCANSEMLILSRDDLFQKVIDEMSISSDTFDIIGVRLTTNDMPAMAADGVPFLDPLDSLILDGEIFIVGNWRDVFKKAIEVDEKHWHIQIYYPTV